MARDAGTCSPGWADDYIEFDEVPEKAEIG